MKRWLVLFVASAALIASTGGKDPGGVEEEPEETGPTKRTDAGLEWEIFSVTAVNGILEGTAAHIEYPNSGPFIITRNPDGGNDPWLEALTPRTVSTTASSGAATATSSLEFQRLDGGHFRFIMSANATSPDGTVARASAGFERLEIVARDRGLKGLKATTQCNASYSGTAMGTGGIKVIAGEIIAGDTVCEYNWLSPTISSGTVENMSPSEETDGTDRKYATIYMDIGVAASSHRFGDFDAGTGVANATVDVIITPQY